jgi:hypothetical protein
MARNTDKASVVRSLLKASLAVTALVGLGMEFGRPAVTRIELHDVARYAADLSQERLADGGPQAAAAQAAREAVESQDAVLTGYDVDPAGRVEVRVSRYVDPLVLDDVPAVEGWYDVEISETADTPLPGG